MSQVFTKTARLGSLLPKVVNGVVPSRTNVTASKIRPFNVPMYVRRWAYNLSGFNQYGLYKNDVLMESEDVVEAIRRLPPQLQVTWISPLVSAY